MKILITGGTGTISSGLVAESVRRGNETFAVTRGNSIGRNIDGACYLRADVWNDDEIHRILGEETFDVIVECLVYNCEQLKMSLAHFAERCQQYVFISTAGVYDRNSDKKRIGENAEKNQVEWSYTRQKIECEVYLKKYFEGRKNRYTIVRPTVTYGDYRIPFPVATRKPTWTLFERLQRNIPVIACTNVEHSIIHIEDFSRAVVGLFHNNGAYNEDFHISSNGNEIYWDDVISISGEILNVHPKIIHIPLEVFNVAFPSIYEELRWNKTTDLVMDDAKLKSVIPEFKCVISAEKGMEQTIRKAREEFSLAHCQIDKRWWENCDITIFYAYVLNRISDNERGYAKEYIGTWSLRKKAKITLKCLKRKMKEHCKR